MNLQNIITFENTKNDLNKKRKLFKISSQNPIILTCKRWCHNRPTDINRVKEIEKYIIDNSRVEGIIYIARIDNELICYDGNHRREAVIKHNIEILVDMIDNATLEEVRYMFEYLNRSEPVAELYFDTSNTVDKIFIIELADKIRNKWRDMEGGRGKTGRCQVGNFTIDKLKNQLYNHYKNRMCDTSLTTDQVMVKIEEINKKYGNNTEFLKTFKPRTLNKCVKNNCYIFLKDFTEDL